MPIPLRGTGGNLLDDGVNTYAYDSANRLINFNGPEGTATYGYNGLGDRLTQNGVAYTLDLNAGLTQVLDDGVNSYTYGIGRISQQQGTTADYFLGDALGSVRQLSNPVGEVTLSKSYDPYGNVIQSVGASQTSYGFASEYTDSYIKLIYLRSRWYDPEMGRFLTRDTWDGNINSPMSYSKWQYVYSNPVNLTDPSGQVAIPCQENQEERYCVLDNDLYKGAYVDLHHFFGGEDMAEKLLSDLRDRIRFGKDDYPIIVEQSFFESIKLSLTYRTSIPIEGLQDKELKQAAYGIFLDYQIRFEGFQGIDPRCNSEFWNKIIPHCSSYSNEDLISDYLGFASYMKNIGFERVIIDLGGGHAEKNPPAGFHPQNYKFTSFKLFGIDRCGNVIDVQQSLPPSLILDYPPMGAGKYWDVPNDFLRIKDLKSWL